MLYELATQTTETSDPFVQNQTVNDFGTEEYTDRAVAAEDREVAIPVGHVTTYPANLRDKLQNVPDSPSSNGDYVMRRTSSGNAYVPLEDVKELPTLPTTDGAYLLKATISSGTPTLAWVAE